MAKERVVPGVQIEVINEIVPQQLYPSGVVGLIGTADKGPIGKPETMTSFQELKEKFLKQIPGSLVNDGKAAFQNGVFQVVAIRVAGSAGSLSSATLVGSSSGTKEIVKLTAKEPFDEPIEVRVLKGATADTVRIELQKGKDPLDYNNLNMDPTSDLYLVDQLNNSPWISAQLIPNEPKPKDIPVPQEQKLAAAGPTLPPTKDSYEKALEALELETSIDVVCICENSDPAIHALVDVHCKNMSAGTEPKPLGPRIGVGTVGKNESLDDILKRTMTSDRFVLVAPFGVAGNVAGLLSKLNYFESPTFKPLTGITDIERRYTPSEQMKLLDRGILPVDVVKGRGVIVVKGITTNKEQISVKRIGDHAMRGIKSVAELFIGNLNNERNRSALRERITEFMIGMEKEGAIVPSVDNTKPAFLVDVYSSQSDFSKGIVRIDNAVRPVRAMDYIYATINVQAF
jgi:hypothetical protein